MPDSLRHKVAVRLQAETGGNAFDVDLQKKTVLDYTFSSAELVGKPLSIGHFVSSSAQGGIIGVNYTHTYSPYILVGQNDGNIEDDPIIRGQDYQEFISSIFGSLANSVVTGVFLEMDVIQPGGQKETFERALVDRVGFAARNRAGETNISINFSSPESTIINEQDITTLTVALDTPINAIRLSQINQFNNKKSEINLLSERIKGASYDALSLEQKDVISKLNKLTTEYAILYSSYLGTEFSAISCNSFKRNQSIYLVKSYFSSVKIIATKAKINDKGLLSACS